MIINIYNNKTYFLRINYLYSANSFKQAQNSSSKNYHKWQQFRPLSVSVASFSIHLPRRYSRSLDSQRKTPVKVSLPIFFFFLKQLPDTIYQRFNVLRPYNGLESIMYSFKSFSQAPLQILLSPLFKNKNKTLTHGGAPYKHKCPRYNVRRCNYASIYFFLSFFLFFFSLFEKIRYGLRAPG